MINMEQIGQLSQTNRSAGWVSFGKNISGRRIMHICTERCGGNFSLQRVSLAQNFRYRRVATRHH